MAETKLNSSVPNLFDYATSELSQDAFLLWLLNWANPFDQQKIVLNYEQKCLHEAAQGFVRMLLDMPTDWPINSVKCYKQKYNIDVLAVVNGKYALIIEDKTDTKEHGKQIATYTEALENDENFKELKQRCVYYKSGNESRHSIEKLSKFYSDPELEISLKTVLRKDVIDLFTPYVNTIKDSIFVDYFNHLQKIENLTNSYMTKPVAKWGSRAWQGFYLALEKCLNEKLNKEEDNWKLCKWINDPYNDAWDFKLPKFSIKEDGSIKLYLQIDSQNGRLSMRTYCNPKKKQDKGWSEPVIEAIYAESDAESFVNKLNKIQLTVVRPERIAESENTTFAYIKNTDDSHFVSGDAIKVDTIADRLLELQSIISDLASSILKISQQKQ